MECPDGDKDFTHEEYISIYGDSEGWEVIQGYITKENGNLNIISGHSIKTIQKLTSLILDQKSCCTILLNIEAKQTNQVLKDLGYRVKGYPGNHVHWRCEVLKIACENGQIWVNSNEVELIEALRTRSDADSYVFPIIYAFEAFGNILKQYTK